MFLLSSRNASAAEILGSCNCVLFYWHTVKQNELTQCPLWKLTQNQGWGKKRGKAPRSHERQMPKEGKPVIFKRPLQEKKKYIELLYSYNNNYINNYYTIYWSIINVQEQDPTNWVFAQGWFLWHVNYLLGHLMGKPLACKLPRGRVVLLWEQSPGATHLVVPGDASCWTSFGLGAHRSPGILLFMGWELERGSQKPNWPSPSPLLLRRKHSEFGSCSLKTDTETGHDF